VEGRPRSPAGPEGPGEGAAAAPRRHTDPPARGPAGDAPGGPAAAPRTAPDASALDAALARLGYTAFRPGQREAVEILLARGHLLLVAPTGGGKSLAYQLPALVLPGTTLVISPLIALMRDQVEALEARGVRATYLASTLERAEAGRRLARIAAGAFDLVYAAPERALLPGFRALLAELDCPLVAVDEAHCISEWGHDFRPEYLELGALLRELRVPRVLACTATATPAVRDEILARLGLPADTPQHVHGFARPELALRAEAVRGRRDRAARVDAALAEAPGPPGRTDGTALVYAPTRRAAEEEARRLAARGYRAAAYHAGLAAEERDRVQAAFTAGELEVVVATNAFGMGIDRSDVRAVVHLAPPGSLEAYYQEVGRAGRDGRPAVGLLLHGPDDLALRRRLLERDLGSGAGADPDADPLFQHKWGLFLELLRYAESGSCRHDAILRYFGDEAETLGGCGRCDNCLALRSAPTEAERTEAELLVRKALSAVARLRARFGLGAAAELLLGRPDPRLLRSGLDRTPTFGILRERSPDFVRALLRRLVAAGLVELTGRDRPTAALTLRGTRVMQGAEPGRVLLPEDAPTPSRRRPRAPAGARPTPGSASPAAASAGDPTNPGDDPAARARFEALRAWRLARARSDGVPPYVVASDRTLRELAAHAPRSRDALLEVHGIGPARVERYGGELLEVLRDPSRASPRTAPARR